MDERLRLWLLRLVLRVLLLWLRLLLLLGQRLGRIAGGLQRQVHGVEW